MRPVFFLQFSVAALLLVAGSLVVGIVLAIEAAAHHPGSHAFRLQTGQVKLEAVAMATNGCTAIEKIEVGAPKGLRPPSGSQPVTLTLSVPAPGQICTQVVRSLTQEMMLKPQGEAKIIHLYIVKQDGQLVSSERVPIK